MKVLKHILLALALLSISCYKERPTESILSKEDIVSKIKPGNITKLSSLTNKPFTRVYVLTAYQGKVDTKAPDSKKINNYLKSIDYVYGEADRALIFLTKDHIYITKFLCDWDLDLTLEDYPCPVPKNTFRKEFHPCTYTDASEAVIAKFKQGYPNDKRIRTCIILGKMKAAN